MTSSTSQTPEKRIALLNDLDYLQRYVGPLIVELADILKQPGVSAHSLMSYFIAGIQSGTLEVWVALKDNKPVGFTSFCVLGWPHYSTGMCNYIFMQEKDAELTEQLYAKFPEFLKKNKLKYFAFHSQTKKLGEHFAQKWQTYGLKVLKTEYLHTGKRKIGGN